MDINNVLDTFTSDEQVRHYLKVNGWDDAAIKQKIEELKNIEPVSSPEPEASPDPEVASPSEEQ